MDPLVALKWATADSAAYMGVLDEVGTISPGKLADVIAVKGSPCGISAPCVNQRWSSRMDRK